MKKSCLFFKLSPRVERKTVRDCPFKSNASLLGRSRHRVFSGHFSNTGAAAPVFEKWPEKTLWRERPSKLAFDLKGQSLTVFLSTLGESLKNKHDFFIELRYAVVSLLFRINPEDVHADQWMSPFGAWFKRRFPRNDQFIVVFGCHNFKAPFRFFGCCDCDCG